MQAQPYHAILVQVAYGAMVALCAVSSGMNLGFTSVANVRATDQFTDDQVSWFDSVAAIATPLGCLAAGPLLDRFGRRVVLLLLNLPFVLGWVLLATAPAGPGGAAQVYAGRACTGLGSGLASVPATVYLGEMAHASLRGVLVSWTSLAISLGILAVYVLGLLLEDSWRLTAAACAAVPAAAALAVLLLVPESPAWLAGRGRTADAERSLRRLRAVPSDAPLPAAVREELDELSRRAAPAADSPSSPGPASPGRCGGLREAGRLLARPQAWKPLLIMNVFFLFQQITGIYVVVAKAWDVVSAAGVELDEKLASVLLGLVQVLAGVAVALAMRRCGRRSLAVWPTVVQALAMVAVAAALQAGDGSSPPPGWGWLPLTALIVYVASSTLGLHTLPWAMLGEVFPTHGRGLLAGLTTCLAYLYNFAVLKAYSSLENSLHGYVFYLFAGTSALAVVFAKLWLPETHGRSMRQIEEDFTPGRGQSSL